MKRYALTGCMLVIFLAMMAPAAMATIGLGLPDGYGPYQTGVGGEFTFSYSGLTLSSAYVNGVTENVPGPTQYGNTFQTFCVEGGEYINAGDTYTAVLNSKAVNGGLSASSGGDPISIGTAWLYSQFATEHLGDYNYSGGRQTSAAELQDTIWALEGEEGKDLLGLALAGNPFANDVLNKFGDVVSAKADAPKWAYGVAVLNISATASETNQDWWYSQNNGRAQDQLVMVPEPSPLLFFGLALIVLAGVSTWRLRRA